MKIIIAILLLGIIIFIHELGHFLLAKKNGITVTEFSLGMGPRIASYTKNGTRYSLKILPIGGSCMMLGEDEDIDDEGAFHKKGVGARFSVIFAGAFFNFILAFVLAVIVIGAVGVDYPEVTELSDESPVYEAGIREGDIIKKINGKTIHFGKDINLYFFFNPVSDAPIDITYQSDGVEKKARITPRLVENSYDLGRFYNIYREKVTPLETVKNSFYEVKYNINYTMQSIKYLVTGRVNINEISGPVGIVSIVGGIIDESESEGAGFAFLNLACQLCITT